MLLLFLTGCAGSQHKHPHDHGLSAIRGQFVTLTRTNERLASVLNDVHIQLIELKRAISSNEARLKATEQKLDIYTASVTRLDKQSVKIVDEIINLSGRLAQVDKRAVTKSELLDELGDMFDDVTDLTSRNRQDIIKILEKLEKLKPQKLIELKEDDEAPWDGKMIGPPWPPIQDLEPEKD
ncbi:MAG: hypothetical protein ACXABY_05880 [Candidatus Thorarchaeota archaeon]